MTVGPRRLCTRCLATIAAWAARWPAETAPGSARHIPARIRGRSAAWFLSDPLLEPLETRQLLSSLTSDNVLRLQTGSYTGPVVAADFNNDGRPDLAATNFNSSTVSVLINNGDGSFAQRVDYPCGSSPQDVTAADFNGDGHPDLAVAAGSNGLNILMNKGDGTFAAKVSYQLGSTTRAVISGDFNGDGAVDLALARENSSMCVLLNNGAGVFGNSTSYAAGSAPWSIKTADINNDGRLDLAVANQSSNTVSVYLGRGDGTFFPKVDYTVGIMPFWLTFSDLNGDGYSDLAVANYTGSVSVLLNVGNGTFAPGVNYATPGAGTSVFAADINGDGKMDLAVSQDLGASRYQLPTTISLLLGAGNGSFAPAVNYLIGTRLWSITSADFNGDGAYDLAASDGADANGGIWVLPNMGHGTFMPQYRSAAGGTANAVLLRDLNADGEMDLVATSTYSSAINVLLGNGDGAFAGSVSYSVGSSPQALATADFNSDGKLDLVVANSTSNSISILLNIGGGQFGPKTDYPVGYDPHAVVAGDFNGDGRPDVAVANATDANVSVLLQKTDGTFANRVNYALAPGSSPQSLVAADFNGDLALDLAAGNYYGNSVSVLLNSGSGTFAPKVDYGVVSGVVSLGAADFNGDGKPDLAVLHGGGVFRILLNTAANVFAPPVLYIPPTSGGKLYGNSFTITDHDGDGAPDIVLGNTCQSLVATFYVASAWRNTGTGVFLHDSDLWLPSVPTSMAAGDLNGDGKADLAALNSNVDLLLTRPATLQANIHGPYTVGLGDSLTLAGAGSATTGTITQWAWDYNYDGSFHADATGPTPVFSAAGKTPGTYVIALQITDNLGATSIQTTTLTVRAPAFRGAAGNDSFRLHLNTATSMVEFYENTSAGDAPTFRIPLALAGDIAVFGGGGADQITLDNGSFAVQADWGFTNPNLTVHLGAGAQLTLNVTTHLGALTLDDASTLTLAGGPGHFLVTTGFTLAPTARLDLTQNDLLVRNFDYTTLLAFLADGRLLSSVANASGGLRAIACAGGFQIEFLSHFSEIIGAADALAKFTYRGDASLDGILNFEDFVAVDAGCLFGGSSWAEGDFDYSGSVTSADYHILKQTYLALQSLPAPAASPVTAPAATSATAEDPITSTPAPIPAPASTTPRTSTPASASQPLPIFTAIPRAPGSLSLAFPRRFPWTATAAITEEDPLAPRRSPTWRIALAPNLRLPSSTPAPRPSSLP